MNSNARLQKEMKNIYTNFADVLELCVIDEVKRIWHVKFSGAKDTLYAGERFTLQFVFDDKYPFEAAEVKFVGVPPIHEHIYANGFICLSILDKDWTPAL